MPRGVADGGSGGGGPDPALLKTGRVDSPRFENEVAQNPVFFRFLGYFGVGWPPCRRFDPPLKKPWRRPWLCPYPCDYLTPSPPERVSLQITTMTNVPAGWGDRAHSAPTRRPRQAPPSTADRRTGPWVPRTPPPERPGTLPDNTDSSTVTSEPLHCHTHWGPTIIRCCKHGLVTSPRDCEQFPEVRGQPVETLHEPARWKQIGGGGNFMEFAMTKLPRAITLGTCFCVFLCLNRIQLVVYFATKCVKTGVVIKYQQNILDEMHFLNGATSRVPQERFDSQSC